MKGLYSSRARGKLAKLLENLGADTDRQDLAEEVDVARSISSQAVELMSSIMEKGDTLKQETVFSIFRFTQEALSHVASLVEKMVKVDAVHNATLDTRQISDIIAQVGDLMAKHLEGQEELLETVLKDLNEITVVAKDKNTVRINLD